MSVTPKSFREQLLALRPKIEEAEKEREVQKQEERERTQEKLAEELHQNPPDKLFRHLRDIEEQHKKASGHFWPVEAIQSSMKDLEEFGQQIERYRHYQGRFPQVYTPVMKRALNQIVADLTALKENINSQLEQWQKAEELVGKITFRHRQKSDDPSLVELAKEFHQRAYGIQLDMPKSFFASKGDHFHVADSGDVLVGYFEIFPGEDRIAFAVKAVQGINFFKLVRGLVHKFCRQGPLPQPLESANIRLYDRKEVKFYTDLGFIRTETLGMSDWLYQRKF